MSLLFNVGFFVIGVFLAALGEIFMGIIFILLGIAMLFSMVKTNNEYNARMKEYKALIEKKENYEKEMLAYTEKLKTYNNENEVYLKKKEVYNSELDEYKFKHGEFLEKEKHDLQALIDLQNKKIEEFDCGISEKFYEDIPQIIEIIKDGRADSLKEGINILLSDKKQNELIKAQYEYNEKKIAIEKLKTEAMVYAMERQAEAMREQAEYAKRRADAIKEQEEDRKRNAPSCYLCINYPCGGNPAYCGSFAKKQ